MEPIWHPLSALPELTSALDEQLADVEQMTAMLVQARAKPHILDAATLDRVVNAYSKAAELSGLYIEQVRRWRREGLECEQSRQTDRLERQAIKYGDAARELVALAEDLKGGCIDAIVAMGDEEFGLAVMTGQLPRSTDQESLDAQMSNARQLPIPLIINERFLRAFLDEQVPCAALGLVEQAREVRGFVAVQIGVRLPMPDTHSGFDFGIEVLGNERCQILHFVLSFPGLEPFDILLNPANTVVGKVVDVMRETGQYFFFVVEPNSLTAFHNHMGRESQEWFDLYGDIVHTATTTEQGYESGAQRLAESSGMLRGQLLKWVCRDNTSSLDLRKDRLEVRYGGS